MANTTKTQAPVNAKANLYADMRIAIVKAHNDGNKKAIDKQRVADLDVDATSYNMWVSECKLLRNACFDYVQKKKNARFNTEITAEQVKEAREKIYPMWKTLLGFGEKGKYDKELKCQESDVEDLVGFVWDFYNTGAGTAETCVKETVFRKKVESLLGCIIAKNEVLTDAERETLSKYQKAIRRQEQANATIDELTEKINNLKFTLAGIPQNESQQPFRDYLENLITSVQTDMKAAEEKLATAEAEEKKYAKDAKAIQKKMKAAK